MEVRRDQRGSKALWLAFLCIGGEKEGYKASSGVENGARGRQRGEQGDE